MPRTKKHRAPAKHPLVGKRIVDVSAMSQEGLSMFGWDSGRRRPVWMLLDDSTRLSPPVLDNTGPSGIDWARTCGKRRR